jgi:hypothetical protein
MSHVFKPECIKVENLEMDGLVRHKVWQLVLRSSLTRSLRLISIINSIGNEANLRN